MRDAKKWKEWLISNAISLGLGAASALLTAGSMKSYQMMKQPPLSPPGWLFPIVWTILYLFMGTSAWLVYRSQHPEKETALRYYAAQLLVNVIWPLIFFRLQAFWAAFFWLLLLWYLVFVMLQYFRKINRAAGIMMTVYLLWCSFAAYLNLGVALLN